MTLFDALGLKDPFPYIEKETYTRYQQIWRELCQGKLKRSFKLEFQKKFDSTLYEDEFYSDKYPRILENSIKLLQTVGWRNNPYDKQHWGNWLHSLSPYQGRMTPSLAHWLIKIFSKKGDVVLDPFMGVGTVPLEADFLQRKAIGVDLNIYGYVVAKGKFERKPLDYYLNYLKEIEDIDKSEIDISDIADWIQAYFHPETLKEIVFLNEKLIAEKEYFLLGCLMGILHGNRPGYLSVWTGCIIPMTPRPANHPEYRPDKDKPEYRAVIPRMAAKIMRMYSTGFPLETNARIMHGDARDLNLKDDSVDVIICSPPYYNTLDYVGQNRVRLYFLGLNKKKQDILRQELIQDSKSYLANMVDVGKELRRVLKDGSLIVFVLGDVHRTKYSINTADEVSTIYFEKLGLEELMIVNDEIPLNKVVSRSKRKKFDRILVLRNVK
ncbi:MAG: DNA adenine methylase [Candidatus Heimdallarchaeota archaeon]|nr:MAG: DNA adenine methylase [Candidatus Heimdallarchaeota archaeon]